MNTVQHRGLGLDTGFIVHNVPNYPLPRPAVPRARGRRAGVRDVVLGRLRRLRARVVGPPAVRAAAERRQPALPPLPARGHPLAPNGRVHAGHVRGTVPRTVRGQTRLLGAVPHALPRAAHVGALVDRPRAGARLPGRARDPLLRPPRDARLRPLPLAHRLRRQPPLRRRAARPAPRHASHIGLGARVASPRPGRRRADDRTTARRAASTRSSSRPTPTRRSRCSPTRPGRAERARRLPLHGRTRPCCTRTSRFLPRAARRPRVVELPRERRDSSRP